MLLTWHYPGPGRDLPEWGHLQDPLLLQAADIDPVPVFQVLSLGLGEHGGDRDPAAGGGEYMMALLLELQTKVREDFTIMEKALTCSSHNGQGALRIYANHAVIVRYPRIYVWSSIYTLLFSTVTVDIWCWQPRWCPLYLYFVEGNHLPLSNCHPRSLEENSVKYSGLQENIIL